LLTSSAIFFPRKLIELRGIRRLNAGSVRKLDGAGRGFVFP